MIKKLIHRAVLYFIPKRIVYSKGYPTGVLVKASDIKGKKYLTIAVTNKAVPGVQNVAVVHHVPANNVTGIQNATTPFKRWLYASVLHKSLPSNKIKKLKK
jgi:hypothetical protein